MQTGSPRISTAWVAGDGVDTRGAQEAWRDWSTVFKVFAGAAVQRLHKLMNDAAKAAAPIPNATVLDDDDREASAQLYWMMLTICKGAALNTVFLAGDSEGLEAWRQLTEKYEPKMRTRFAGQLMSILSCSLQCDTTQRITAWEREVATYERDSGKILDDEIKVGAVLLRLPESKLKTHLLMRVDKLKKWTDFRDEVAAISRAIAVAQSQPTPMDIGAVGKGKSGKVARDRKELANVTIRLTKHVPGAETVITLLQTILTLTKRAEMWKGWSFGKCVSSSGTHQPKAKGGQKNKGGGKSANAVKTCWNCGESGHMSSQCTKKKVHVVEESSTTASQAGSQDTIMVGSIGSYFDVGSMSEWTLEPRGADEKICSMGAPNVREGESVDIEIDSGAEVSCFHVNIDADMYPLHETRLSMGGGHRVAGAVGKLQELGAPGPSVVRLQTCEAML